MVATIRNWAFDANHTVAGGTEDAQAQDSWFRFLELLRGNVGVDSAGAATSAGAWTMHSSSDGTTTAGTGDNITASTNIVFAAAGVNHSWALLQQTFGSRTLYLCVDFNAAASPWRTAQMIIMPSAPTTAGTLTNRPAHTDENLFLNNTFFTSAGFAPRTVHGWRSDIGEFVCAFSVDGTQIAETAIAVFRPDSGETGVIWPVITFYSSNANLSTRGALGANSFLTSNGWEGFWQDNTPLTATMQFPTVLGSNTSFWTNGRSNIGSNAIGDAPVDVVWDSTIEAAYVGRIVDWRATPENIPSNETQDGDTDPVRRISIGEMWAPVRAADGPLVL